MTLFRESNLLNFAGLNFNGELILKIGNFHIKVKGKVQVL